MSVRSVGIDPPPIQSTSARELTKTLKQAVKNGQVLTSTKRVR